MKTRSRSPWRWPAAAAALLMLAAGIGVGIRIERPRIAERPASDVRDDDSARREVALELAALRAAAPAPAPEWRTPAEMRRVLQPQSLILLAAAVLLMAASRLRRRRTRLAAAAAAIALLATALLGLPLTQPIRMGDLGTYVGSRSSFDAYMAGDGVRFEAHLSAMILRGLDAALGSNERSPARAFQELSGYAALWFAAMLVVAGWTLGWSPSALRYLALAVAAPASLLYFGYRELGYLSLNPAVFPLVVTGFRRRWGRLHAGTTLAGLGAALHAFGLLSLVGTACAAVAARTRLATRVAYVAQAFASGTSAYLIWIFLYVAVLGLRIVPGHAESVPWRPLAEPVLAEHRVNAALLSPEGALEAGASLWIAGAPLLLAALALARRHWPAVRVAVAYTLPSLVFLVMFWPIQGLAVEADLLVGAFPALYALAWLAARTGAASWWSLAVLASGHAVLWHVLLGDYFVNVRVY